MLRHSYKSITWSRAVFKLRNFASCSSKTNYGNMVPNKQSSRQDKVLVSMSPHIPLHTSDRTYCTSRLELTESEYEELADETLDSLTEMFEDLPDQFDLDPDYDVTFNSGVLTVKISNEWGTYVINKQTPNKQIWLSSPISGPKRYDFENGVWIYKHDGGLLHELLNKEISQATQLDLDFTVCSFGQKV